jgi:DNA-binding NarL/FixJ family response regulator
MKPKFTARELEVLLLLCCEGLSNADIAKRLQLSVNTVKRYIEILRDKVNVSSRTQLVVYFYRQKLQPEQQQVLDYLKKCKDLFTGDTKHA